MYKLTVENLHKSYGSHEVLKGVSLNAKTGEVLNTLQLDGSVESSPAVYRDVLVICTNGTNTSNIYGIKLQ